MKVKELIKELKRYPQDATVVKCTNWSECDEFGIVPTEELDINITDQIIVDVNGIEDTEHIEVILL